MSANKSGFDVETFKIDATGLAMASLASEMADSLKNLQQVLGFSKSDGLESLFGTDEFGTECSQAYGRGEGEVFEVVERRRGQILYGSDGLHGVAKNYVNLEGAGVQNLTGMTVRIDGDKR